MKCQLKLSSNQIVRGQVYTLDKAALYESANGIKLRFVKSVDLTP
jgi:hypothetical protein